MEVVGIYEIACVVTNKVYIGQSINIPRRRSEHFSELRRGLHANQHLQHSFDFYGEL